MLRALFRENGAEVVGFYHSFRFVSQQTFVVAQKRAPIEARLAATARITRDLLDLPLGRAPGSLGAWLGVDRGLPVLTIELPGGEYEGFRAPALAALRAAASGNPRA